MSRYIELIFSKKTDHIYRDKRTEEQKNDDEMNSAWVGFVLEVVSAHRSCLSKSSRFTSMVL